MTHPAFRTLALASLLAGLLLAGCTDGLTGVEEAPAEEQAEQPEPKFRHMHLYQAPLPEGAHVTNRLLTRYEDLVASNDFVLGTSSIVLDMNKLISRYSEIEGVTVKRSYKKAIKGFAIHVAGGYVQAVLDLILADPEIDWVEPDANVRLNKPVTTGVTANNAQYLPWNIDRVDADKATASFDNTATVALYVLDSGVKHRDLNVVERIDFQNGEENWTKDFVGHGTHVAGTAAAIHDDQGVLGVGFGARVHDFKVLDDNGQTDLSTIIAAVDLITMRKLANPAQPMVVNISFGADVGTSEYNALDEAIEASIGAGVIYVIAAGNEGIDASTVTPAHVAGAITVGAYDRQNTFALFSNYGPVVDLLAPGVDVISLVSEDQTGNPYNLIMMSGTSMAAPHVAGGAVLLLSKQPSLSPAEVRDVLVAFGCDAISTGDKATSRSIYANGDCALNGGSLDSGDGGTTSEGGGKGKNK